MIVFLSTKSGELFLLKAAKLNVKDKTETAKERRNTVKGYVTNLEQNCMSITSPAIFFEPLSTGQNILNSLVKKLLT